MPRPPKAAPAPAIDQARTLMEKVVFKAFMSDAKEAAAAAEARRLYGVALEAFQAAGDTRGEADVYYALGYLAQHGEDDPVTAEPLFLRAAEGFARLGDTPARLEALLELQRLDPFHPVLDQAVTEAIAAGLPADLDPASDPIHLIPARREVRAYDAALALARSLYDEAVGRDDMARGAKMLCQMGLVEDARKDRKAARAHFEASLEMAEAAGSNEETLRALLHLIDAWWSTGNHKRARELFARAEKVRGVPKSLRDLRKIAGWALK